MSDFDWQGTCAAVKAAAEPIEYALAGEAAGGTAYGSYPLAADGNYSFWVYSDPYKATITKETNGGKDIAEVEEDVYEAHNISRLLAGDKSDTHLKEQGVRLNGTKYTILRELATQKYSAKVDGVAYDVTIDKVCVGKSKDGGIVIATKGGYYFAARYTANPRSDPFLAVAEAIAVGFYWAVGPDA